MISGHGDDTYSYDGIRSDFSSNICPNPNLQVLARHLSARTDLLSHYPEPEAWSLERLIAEVHGISPEEVVVTAGATEAIYLTAQTFDLEALIDEPTFSEYSDACAMFRGIGEPAPHRGRMAGTMRWICCPNNPTGSVAAEEEIERAANDHDIVVLDLSYRLYTDCRLITPQRICAMPGVIGIHSMTKTYGVPGLRLGYITTNRTLTAMLRRRMRPWSVSPIAIEAGKYLLAHPEMRCRPDLSEAQRLRARLIATGAVSVAPTATTFMLCTTDGRCTAAELKHLLATRHHLLIRDASNFRGLSSYHFRLATQTPPENDALVDALCQVLDLKG